MLNFRPQCRKFLEKVHALAIDEQKETSKTTTRDQVTGPATAQAAPLVPATSVAVPPVAQSSDIKNSTATFKTITKEESGKVTTKAKVAPKKPQKDAAPLGVTDEKNKQYMDDYLKANKPSNDKGKIIHSFMEAAGSVFGVDGDEDDLEDI